jgi:hypothetical protein
MRDSDSSEKSQQNASSAQLINQSFGLLVKQLAEMTDKMKFFLQDTQKMREDFTTAIQSLQLS